MKQNLLQKEAKEVLDHLQLIKLLEKYGNPKIVGSMALGLMSWKDIDLFVKTNPNYDDCLKIVGHLFKKPKVYSLQLQDFRKSIYPNRPNGIYLGIKYLKGKSEDSFWKIDIWFMEVSEAEKLTDLVKEKLTNDTQNIILKIKNEMRKKAWGKKISGVDVYKAVLQKGVKNLDDLKRYLRKQKKTVFVEKEYKF